jgi:hypothetical protein
MKLSEINTNLFKQPRFIAAASGIGCVTVLQVNVSLGIEAPIFSA